MDYLKKTWVRIIISLLIGAVSTEFITMNSVDTKHQRSLGSSAIYTLMLGVIFYIILTDSMRKKK